MPRMPISLSDARQGIVFKHILHLPKIDYYNPSGRKLNIVDIEIELRRKQSDVLIGSTLVLSICGGIWNMLATDYLSCGQNLDEIGKLYPRDHRVQRLVAIWRVWHLNDMNAGCRHQRAMGWGTLKLEDGKWSGHIRSDEHPLGVLGKQCPECGYRYGTKWLTEELPREIIDEIKEICAAGPKWVPTAFIRSDLAEIEGALA